MSIETDRYNFRFPVVGIPTTASNYTYTSCAFTQGIIHFCKMMKRLGYTVFHYGHSDSIVDCDQHITISNNEDLKRWYGNDYVEKQTWKQTGFSYDQNDECHKEFYGRCFYPILENLKNGDFICIFDGCNASGLINSLKRDWRKISFFAVEPQIGYNGSFAEYRVFTSNALRIRKETTEKYCYNISNLIAEMNTKHNNTSKMDTLKYYYINEYSSHRYTVIPYCIDKDDFIIEIIHFSGE